MSDEAMLRVIEGRFDSISREIGGMRRDFAGLRDRVDETRDLVVTVDTKLDTHLQAHALPAATAGPAGPAGPRADVQTSRAKLVVWIVVSIITAIAAAGGLSLTIGGGGELSPEEVRALKEEALGASIER